MADVPLVRLFISSENEEDALVNVGEVLGLETEERKETHDEAAAAGYVGLGFKMYQLDAMLPFHKLSQTTSKFDKKKNGTQGSTVCITDVPSAF